MKNIAAPNIISVRSANLVGKICNSGLAIKIPMPISMDATLIFIKLITNSFFLKC